MSPGMAVSRRERGVALAIVVWFIAGMSLLVAGIVSQARLDTRMTQVHVGRAKAVTAGDGAIQLAMVARQSGSKPSAAGPMITTDSYQVGDTEVTVLLYPASGFIDLNNAPAEMLVALFVHAGQLSPGKAKFIADNVVKWRKSASAGNTRALQSRRFFALEDLLQVEGANRSLLDGIRGYAVAGDWTRGAIQWSASPQDVVRLLGQLNPAEADSVMRRRDNMAQAGAGGKRKSAGDDGLYRADALVNYGGRTWLRRRWLAAGSSMDSRLPWRVVRTEPPRVVEG